MKKFEDPVINLEKLELEDVITTSTCQDDNYDPDCPWLVLS